MKLEPNKRRDSEATRERILDCARTLFSEKGFENTSTREIAACAHVNIALVSRYFGSKKQLFVEAILPQLDVTMLLEFETKSLAQSVARLYASKGPKDGFDPMLALIRSAGSPEVGDVVREAINKQVIEPFSEKFTGKDAEQRATVFLALLCGFDFFHRIVGVESLSEPFEDASERSLQAALSRLLD